MIAWYMARMKIGVDNILLTTHTLLSSLCFASEPVELCVSGLHICLLFLCYFSS
jgi:hypothetical protein